MRNRSVKSVAFGGMFAAVALVIMCLGGLIPLATFVCPMLATLVGQIVLRACGEKTAWCWYGTVAILSAFLAPDKEGAAVFIFLGYYPILKPHFEKFRFGWSGKLLLFNVAVCVMYWILLKIVGMDQLADDYEELGKWGGAVMLLLGNLTFFLLDKLLTKFSRK